MPSALPIAGVSAGAQTSFGSLGIQNVAATIAPPGLLAGKVSFQHSIYFDGQVGATIWLAFDQAYTNQPTAINVPFVFGGDLNVAGVSGGSQTQFGKATLTKSAQDFAPAGWDSATLKKPLVWNYIENGGASVNFLFTDAYAQPPTINVPFYFGGDAVVGGATAGTQTQFGQIQDVEKPLQISPVGFVNRVSQVGIVRVGFYPPVNFSFLDTYANPSALNAPFYFGDGLAITAGGLSSLSIGLPKATKLSLDFTPASWDSLRIGRPSTYFYGQTGATVNFSFVSSYPVPNTLNVPFYFAGLINANPLAWDSSAFGTSWISNYTRYLQPPGSSDNAIGSHSVVNDIEFGVVPVGIPPLGFGIPAIEIRLLIAENVTAGLQTSFGTSSVKIVIKQFVYPNGYVATKWGTAYADYFNRYLTVPGTIFTKWGVPWASHYVRYLYQGTGTPATKWGVPQVFTRRFVLTLGSESLVFGTSAIDWLNVLRPGGINSLSIGTAWSSHSPRYVAQYPTAAHTRYGLFEIRNSRQYIVCTPDPMWDHVSNRGFGPYLEIKNLARVLDPDGFHSLRMGLGTDVYNNSWLVFPVPIPPTAVPSVGSISNAQRAINPYGYSLTTVGELPFVSLAIRYLTVFGFRATGFGIHQLLQGDAPFGALGWQQTRYGQPTIIEWLRRIIPINTNARFTEWGKPEIYLDVPRYLLPDGIEGTKWGTQVVHHFIQNIYQHYPHSGNYFGTAQVVPKNRRIYPTWFVASQYGTHTVGRDVSIFTPGLYLFGAGIPNVQWGNVAMPLGTTSTAFGDGLWISRSPRVINCNFSQSYTEWGKPRLKNIRQYLVQYEDPDWFRPYNRGFGPNVAIANVNRTLWIVGWLSDRLGVGANVLNAARQLSPLSLAPSSEPQIAFISQAQRYIYPTGLNSLWISWYSAIYNAARALYPAGIASTAVVSKVYYVESNKRFIKTHTGSDTEWGSTMIAFRIRTVNVYLGKEFLRFGLETTAALFEQYFPIEGKDFGRVGQPVVLGPFKKEIKPRWYKGLDWFGYPLVKNKIPQAFTQGWLSFDPGMSKHWVSFRVRSVVIPGLGPDTMFGRLSIKDRKQTVFMIGQATFGTTVLHRIWNVRPDGPSTRIVVARGFSIFDILAGTTGAGHPHIQGMPMPEGFSSMQFGTTWIRVQGCITKWEWPSSQWSFGTPSLNPTQYIDLKDTTNLKCLFTQWGKPRVTPHTIWCRLDTPEQAILNHLGNRFHELDVENPGNNDSVGPWWGNAFVSDGAPRYLRQYHTTGYNPSQAAGGWVPVNANIESTIRFIYPSGAKQTKFGYPEFPFLKDLWAGNIVFTQMGEPSVAFPEGWTWTVYVYASLGVATKWGSHRAELLNRPIYMVGSSMTQWGNNTPMVHFPRIVYPQGLNATQFGDNKPTYRIRNLYVEGFEGFISEYDLDFFADQMRVRWKTNPMYAIASDMASIGTPSIGLKYQYIRPYQIIGSRCLGHNVIVSRGQ